jgi:small subunit ribosomal protein S6e
MAKFKVVVSDPETGKSSFVEVEESRAVPLIGRRIGETIDGSALGLSGHKVLITGGCDNAGFPMRPDVHGGVKSKVLLSGGVGYNATEKGIRRRKTIRGNMITEDVAQINVKIVEKPQEKPPKAKKAKKTGKGSKSAGKPEKADSE